MVHLCGIRPGRRHRHPIWGSLASHFCLIERRMLNMRLRTVLVGTGFSVAAVTGVGAPAHAPAPPGRRPQAAEPSSTLTPPTLSASIPARHAHSKDGTANPSAFGRTSSLFSRGNVSRGFVWSPRRSPSAGVQRCRTRINHHCIEPCRLTVKAAPPSVGVDAPLVIASRCCRSWR